MKGMSHWLAAFGVAVLATLSAVSVSAGEWTAWRGQHQTGVSDETGLISEWSPEGKNLLWQDEFIGRSTPVVFDGRVCAGGRSGEGVSRQERVACWDAATGRKLWEDRFNVYNTTVPFNRVGWASLVGDPDTGYVFAHGVAGEFRAYDRNGKVVWSHFLTETVGHLHGYGGRTQTPLVDGDQVILSFVSASWGKHAAPRHRYFSFDKRTGDLLWISTPGRFPKDMNTQSGQVIAEIGGRRLLIGGNADGFVYALVASTGEKVWEFQLSKRGLNSMPLVVGERVYISHSEENLDEPAMGRMVAIDATGKGDVTATHEIWRINELAAGFPSPAYKDGRLYVLDNSANLHAIDATDGKILWDYSIGTVGKASPVLADGKIYVTEVNGRFHIIEPGETEAKGLDHDQVKSDGERYAEIYGSPAIADGRIYFTSEAAIYCLGDPAAKPSKASRKKHKKKKAKKKKPKTVDPGEVAWIQVVPAESLSTSGEGVGFEVRAFDAKGTPLGAVPAATWKLEGVGGSIDDRGAFVAGGKASGGNVTAEFSGHKSSARARVVPQLPWKMDFEGSEPGGVPAHWVGAKGKYKIEDRDGNTVLTKLYRPKGLLRNALYMGPSDLTDYTIQADVTGAKKGRRRTDAGLINGGYTLDLMGNQQRVEVRSWPSERRMAQKADFEWEVDVWYRMKLRVDTDDDKALIRGKVWPAGKPEPSTWTITVEDPHPIPSGSPGLLGYSPADVYYDNIEVMVNR